VCARGDGIRRSKDLRAEIGKFPNSTNERKKMSTKTLRKRIAVVAVSALTAGVLSVTSAPVANATIIAGDFTVAKGTALAGYNLGNQICADTTASGADSATIPVTGQLSIAASAGDDDNTARAEISGPGVILSAGSAWTIAATTVATSSDLTATVANQRLTVAPTGVGTIKITLRNGVASTASAVDVVTITVVAACANSALSLANSYFAIVDDANSQSSGTFATNVDEDASLIASGDSGFIRMKLKDAYAGTLDAAALIATATGANCLVGIGDTTSALIPVGKSASAVDSDTASDDVVAVAQSDSDLPAKCTVNVTFGGVSIGTKTFTFQGIPSKVTVSDVTVGANSAYGYYRVTVADSAGNLLPSVKISASSTNADNVAAINSGVITNVQSNTDAATSATAGSGYGKTQAVTGANVSANTSGALGLTRYTCGAGGGTAKIQVRALISAATATYVSSDSFAVACGGSLATWTISMDKASYNPGEIATLTLSGKDSDGRPVSTFTLLSGVESAFGGLTAVTAPTNNDAFSSGAGIKTYQYSVGTSEGAFVGTFKTTGSTDTAAKTVQYKIVASTATVSNADVLKSIVALIASINKQIQALQKLILKR
jgi:hypothetical protein